MADDLPPPDPLTEEQRTDHALLLSLIGERTVACLLSKSWALRQAGAALFFLSQISSICPTTAALLHLPLFRVSLRLLVYCCGIEEGITSTWRRVLDVSHASRESFGGRIEVA
eukprot:6179304-Pleurochrysis_carterae.AAC.1